MGTKMKVMGATALTLAMSSVAAHAACYEQRLAPASVSCTRSSSNSADFGANCSSVAASVYQVAVACPEPPKPPFDSGKSGDYYSGTDSTADR